MYRGGGRREEGEELRKKKIKWKKEEEVGWMEG